MLQVHPERGLQRVVLVGLATDFCVAWSAIDARKAGFAATVIEDVLAWYDRFVSTVRLLA